MASLVSALKRKLASITPFTGTGSNSGVETAEERFGLDEEDGRSHDEHRPRKRQRLLSTPAPESIVARSSTSYTPLLVKESSISLGDDKAGVRKCNIGISGSSQSQSNASDQQPSALLRLIPNDVLSHCLSYINTSSDRYALQVSCKVLRDVSNCEEILARIDLGGMNSYQNTNIYSPFDNILENNDNNNNVGGGAVDDVRVGNEIIHDFFGGHNNNVNEPTPGVPSDGGENNTSQSIIGGIILDSDTSVMACKKLIKFAAAGNMQAIYMIAMILCYCHENISEGVALLRLNAGDGCDDKDSGHRYHLPSIYALALILRDSRSVESDYHMNRAASLGYAPAWQEKLTAAEMRAQFGDLPSNELVQYLDPPCLNRLIGRHYLECQRVRKHQTSHCWNPLCGRWAYKALRVETVRGQGGGGGRRGRHHQLIARLNEQLAANAIDVNDLLAASQNLFDHVNANDNNIESQSVVAAAAAGGGGGGEGHLCSRQVFSIESLLPDAPLAESKTNNFADSTSELTPLEKIRQALQNKPQLSGHGLKVSRMKMCSSCRRAKYCSKLCQVYDWRSGRHKMECQFL